MPPPSLLRSPRLEPLISTLLRSRLVRESLRFAWRELTAARGWRVYRVRESGLRLVLEHRTPDVLTLDQGFYQHAYEPPAPALRVLERLGRPPRALDLGANIGVWSLWWLGRFPGASVLALEPDPENAAKQRRTIELQGASGRWTLLEAAATVRDGEVHFTTGAATTGHMLGEGAAAGHLVPARDVFGLLDGVDLLKVDIEGAEWALLADARFARLPVPVVMLEHHPRSAPPGSPRDRAAAALQAGGYSTRAVQQEPDGTGVVWGWREDSPAGSSPPRSA